MAALDVLGETRAWDEMETPETISETLAALEGEIRLAGDDAADWAPDAALETGLGSRLAFLRWAKFDPAKARVRRKAYWIKRFEVFAETNGAVPAPDHPSLSPVLSRGILELPNARDKEGRQLFVLRLPRVDYSEMTPDDMNLNFWYMMHAAHEDDLTQRRGISLINDMEGMERKHFKRDTIRLISGSLQDILPVRVGGAFVVHTPWWFGWLFSVASVFMKAKLRARMHALGDDVEALGTWFELESIPVGCGGTLEWDHAAWVQARRSAAASLGGGGQQAAAEVGSLGSLAESPVLES